MTVHQISIVLIGCGLIGPRHAQHVVQRPDTSLFAIVDYFGGEEEAQKFGVPLYRSIKEMITKSKGRKPDGAIVATPNHTHVPIAAELASYGIHLLVEKPLSTLPEDSKALLEYAEQQNVKLLVGHHRRFNPYILATKRNLGKCGDIVAIQGTWALRKPKDYFLKAPWRTEKSMGGGALLINLIHDIDLLQYLFGPVEKVYAELLNKKRAEYPSVDEGAVLTLRFVSGVAGTFICSDNVTSPFNFEAGTGENPNIPLNKEVSGFYRIFGSNGTISVPDMTLFHQPQVSEKSWTEPIVREDLIKDELELQGVPFDLQLEHFVKVVNGEEEPFCTAIDGMNALLTVEAVSKSIETGLPEYVESSVDVKPNFASLQLDKI